MHQPPLCRVGFLSHLGVLTAGGPDRLAFLQGQATCDFRNRDENQAWPGAFCNAKGRVIANFLALRDKEVFRLILSRDLLDMLRAHLQRYILRAKVTLAAGDGFSPLGILWADSSAAPPVLALPPDALAVRRDGGRIWLRMWGEAPRGLILTTQADAAGLIETYVAAGCAIQESPDFWRREDILAGWPWIGAATRERFTPHMLDLDKRGAVSFDKGCYTGQEVVARTHYRGAAKRGIRRVEGTGSPPPAPGEVHAGGEIADSAPSGNGWVGLVVTAEGE